MTALQTTVLVLGTSVLAVSSFVIVWRELRGGSEASFQQSWRDYAGLAITFGGLAVLVAWLWAGL